jgi:hypothetical protein
MLRFDVEFRITGLLPSEDYGRLSIHMILPVIPFLPSCRKGSTSLHTIYFVMVSNRTPACRSCGKVAPSLA